MINTSFTKAYVGVTTIKEVRFGDRLVLAPNGNKLWYDGNKIPSLDLRFAEDKSLLDATADTHNDLSSPVTHRRSSSATYVDSNKTIKTATTNYFEASEGFGAASSWNKGVLRGTVTDDAATAPDGTNTATLLVENTTTNGRYLANSSSFVSGTTYTVSCWAKQYTTNRHFGFVFVTAAFGENKVATFDLTNGTATHGGGGTARIEAYPNGWYRCSLTHTATDTASAAVQLRLTDSATTATSNYTGDGASGIYVWGAQLEQSSNVGEYVKTTGTISSAPRFDHDPTTGESLGLLVEQSRQNFVTYSEDFTEWTNTNTTDAIDTSITAPDGTNTATKITDDSTDAAHNVKLSFTTDSSDTFTASCFVKQGDFSHFIMVLRMAANSENVYAKFDFDNPSNNTTFGGGTNKSQTVTEYPNGWYHISFTSSFGAAVTSVIPHIHLTASNGATSYSGSGNYNYIWGAQLEDGDFSTSYIPTSGSSVTRSVDITKIDGNNFDSFYNQSEGTVFYDAHVLDTDAAGPTLIAFSEGGGNDSISIKLVSETNHRYRIRVGGVNQIVKNPVGASNIFNRVKVAFAFKVDDAGSSGPDSISGEGTPSSLPTVDRLTLGATDTGASQVTGHFRRFTFWPSRLNQVTLQRTRN